jgi:hypothetical protein
LDRGVLPGIKSGKREEKEYCLSLPGKNWLRDAQWITWLQKKEKHTWSSKRITRLVNLEALAPLGES